MRTVDPELWYKRVKKPLREEDRLRFGSYQASNYEIRLRTSFSKAMKDLASNVSLTGARPARYTRKPVRNVYLSLIVLGVWSAVLMMIINVYQFQNEPPLLVNQQPVQNPLQHIEFPAVALCSYNVISKHAIQTYARRLASLDTNRTFTLPQIKNNLLAFGGLITKTSEPFDIRFLKFLSDVEHEINVTNIMLKLAPKCESILERCSWKAKTVPCHLLFATRITGSGFCCVMNARYSPEDTKRKAKYVQLVGQEQGLMVVVKQDVEDVAFLRRPCHDVEVTLFDGLQYPLTEVSGVHSYPARFNSAVYFKLRFEVQYTSNQLRYHSEDWRGCHVARQGGGRNEAVCILQCRRNATLALCSCVPYTLQPKAHHKVCSPEHLPCLHKHRNKLIYFKPSGTNANHVNLKKEQSDGVACTQCQPDCTRLVYSAKTNVVHFDSVRLEKLFANKLLKGTTIFNTTIIRIFYASEEDQIFYKLETNLRLFENIAILASQWMLLSGGSLLLACEVIYHFTIRWRHQHTQLFPNTEQFKGRWELQ